MPTPASLTNSPKVSDWLDFTRDGYVAIKTGKVEFGQGILTALLQIVAEELNVPLEKCYPVAASTALSPNEGFTAGSLSVQDSGSALRLASAIARVRAGSESYWVIAATLGWDIPIDVNVIVKRPEEYSLVGRSTQRIDLDSKVQGKPSYIHDLRFENLLFARVLRPPADSQVVHERGVVGPGDLSSKASYSRPYLSHGSIGTVTAVAQWVDDFLHVWSQTQGVYPLRADIARAFGLDIDHITVTHMEGAGCYGHNGADDVAFDAALVARHVSGKPILLSWSREDELSWAPFGPAMRWRHLSDPRGRDVITKVAEISGWGQELPDGCGKGIGFARYKNKGAWCAVVAQVEAETHVKVTNL
ncbi:MAG TPA: molybdopterin cofactor-binding domain-containing protein [Candidatus Paceibacterota bacterium]|nr:molybdopterin cofactor-binding domain-containing protein [Candidatus Paceibacterota bacterium]